MKVENLTAAAKLFFYRLPDDNIVEFKHVCLNRNSVVRRLFKNRHIANTAHCHVQRSRNRRRGKRQCIDTGGKLFQLLLCRDSKSLFLIDNDKSEILEDNIL